MTDQLETLEDRVAAIPDTTITKGDVSLSWDGLEYTYRAFGREIDRDEALALLRALETEEDHGGSRLFRLAASTPKAEGVIYAKREGDRVRWYRHMDIHNRMEFYGRAEASLFTIDEVKRHIKTVQGYTDQGGWISSVWPELAKPDENVTDPKQTVETALYKAATNYAVHLTPDAEEQYAFARAFRAGAEWQARQIMAAIEEAIK